MEINLKKLFKDEYTSRLRETKSERVFYHHSLEHFANKLHIKITDVKQMIETGQIPREGITFDRGRLRIKDFILKRFLSSKC
jgi:reverse gyrase